MVRVCGCRYRGGRGGVLSLRRFRASTSWGCGRSPAFGQAAGAPPVVPVSGQKSSHRVGVTRAQNLGYSVASAPA